MEGVRGIPTAVRAVDAGASPEDVATAMTAAYEAVFRLLFLLSAKQAEEGDGSFSTGWAVVAADLLETGEAVPEAGRPLEFLHEHLLTADPTGQEGPRRPPLSECPGDVLNCSIEHGHWRRYGASG
ncbi:MAG TPA: hypothetical protein VFZ85_01880 [Jiangellaceae bacterium]